MSGQIDADGVYRIGGVAPDLSHELRREQPMSHPSVEQVEKALAASDYPDAPTPRAADRRRALAVLALFESETVTTAAELDVLPEGAIILDGDHDVMFKVWGKPANRSDFWSFLGNEHEAPVHLPAAVIYRGGDR